MNFDEEVTRSSREMKFLFRIFTINTHSFVHARFLIRTVVNWNSKKDIYIELYLLKKYEKRRDSTHNTEPMYCMLDLRSDY